MLGLYYQTFSISESTENHKN